MYKSIILAFFFNLFSLEIIAATFSLDTFNIEINSSFLGKEILLFGQKDEEKEVIIIFEGEKKKARLNTKVKDGLFWTNKTQELKDIPSFFAIFTTPKKSLNEIFLIQDITNKHSLINNFSDKLYLIRSALNQKGLYYEDELEKTEGNLFFKKFQIPDNISDGDISIHIYEVQKGLVTSYNQKKLSIQKKGMISNLENLLFEQSFFYAFILVLFSITFSLVSNFIFRKK